MATTNNLATNAVQNTKTVADPIAAYESIRPIWEKSRAVCSGERFVKTYDGFIDPLTFTNLLIPFSPSMTQKQYEFYKAEAEFPGITSQYAKMLVGGLLRKQPILKVPDSAPADSYQWIMDNFGQDGSTLTAFLDRALWEEMQTSRAWVFVDYPKLTEQQINTMTKEEFLEIKPYPILLQAESVINWKVSKDEKGCQQLTSFIVRSWEHDYSRNEFHPEYISVVTVHEIIGGYYQIRKYKKKSPEQKVAVVAGKEQQRYDETGEVMELSETNTNILINGERLKIIPAWPLNGSIDVTEPILSPIVDREVALYNKISRRNHLLYGAATYTPVIISDMEDSKFDEIVAGGLGSWIRLRQGDTADVLKTPTEALVDMDRAIASTVEDMAKLGIRMLTPETAQSGIALELRNAAQTSQLGTLNTKISNVLSDIIAFMLNWRFNTDFKSTDIDFALSADFNPAPLGADWLRLATEWYQGGLVPRSVWLGMLKTNDMIPPDYDDVEGQKEITADELVITPSEQVDMTYAQQLAGNQQTLDNTRQNVLDSKNK